MLSLITDTIRDDVVVKDEDMQVTISDDCVTKQSDVDGGLVTLRFAIAV